MAAITVGRVCVKKKGRDAGAKCVITKIINENFVEIKSAGRKKNTRCSIRHLEPLPKLVNIANEMEMKEELS